MLNTLWTKWGGHGFKRFRTYFWKTWVNNVDFNKWQIFRTPPGYAMTNSPIESYNNKIKTQFTERRKFHLASALNLFEKVMEMESAFDFSKKPHKHALVPKYFVNLARTDLKNKVVKVVSLDKEDNEEDDDEQCVKCKVIHKSNDEKEYVNIVVLNNECFCVDCCYCNCGRFLDKAMCYHFVPACVEMKIEFPGTYVKQACYKRKVGRTRKAADCYTRDD